MRSPEPGPLRSAGVTRHRCYYGPIRHPARPGLPLTRVPLKVTRLHRQGFPCCASIPLGCMPTPLPRWDRKVLIAHCTLRRRPSSACRRVSSHITCFEACSAFTQVSACILAGPPSGPFHRRLRRFRHLHRRSDCFRLERPSCRVGFAPTGIQAPWHGALHAHVRRPATEQTSGCDEWCKVSLLDYWRTEVLQDSIEHRNADESWCGDLDADRRPVASHVHDQSRLLATTSCRALASGPRQIKVSRPWATVPIRDLKEGFSSHRTVLLPDKPSR